MGIGGVPGNMHTNINTACAVIVCSVIHQYQHRVCNDFVQCHKPICYKVPKAKTNTQVLCSSLSLSESSSAWKYANVASKSQRQRKGKVGVGGVPENMYTKINTACAVCVQCQVSSVLQSQQSKDKYRGGDFQLLDDDFVFKQNRTRSCLEICKASISTLHNKCSEARAW